MIGEMKHIIEMYKDGKITDIVLSRSMTDYIHPVCPTIKVKIVRVNPSRSAGQLACMQTIPERKNGRMCSVLFIEQRLLDNMCTDDILETLHNEVRNNSIYIKMFIKFLNKHNGTQIERSDILVLLLEMYMMSYGQMTPGAIKRIHESGGSFSNMSHVLGIKNDLENGTQYFLQAQEKLKVMGIPHWLIDCCEKIAISSGASKQIFDIKYDVDIDTLKKELIDERSNNSEKFEYVSGSKLGAHTAITTPQETLKRGDFRYPDKQD